MAGVARDAGATISDAAAFATLPPSAVSSTYYPNSWWALFYAATLCRALYCRKHAPGDKNMARVLTDRLDVGNATRTTTSHLWFRAVGGTRVLPHHPHHRPTTGMAEELAFDICLALFARGKLGIMPFCGVRCCM